MWQELYRLAPAAQQQELLALARRRGLAHGHHTNGSNGHSDPPRIAPAESGPNGAPASEHLHRILSNPAVALEPVPETPLTYIDAALDETQRRAVAHASATPDVCVIAGWPGTGKSRVATEIITQAARAGQRVLFAASSATLLDVLLPQLAEREGLSPVRLLAPGETADSLPAPMRELTPGRRGQALCEQVLEMARRCRQAAESQCARRRQEEPLWPGLQALVEQADAVAQQLRELEQRREQVTGDVEAQTAALDPSARGLHSAYLADILARRERLQLDLGPRLEQRQRLEQERAQAAQQLADAERRALSLRPLAEAKERGRWWSWTWWRATLGGSVASRFAEAQEEQRRAQTALAAIDAQLQRLERECQELEAQCQRDVDTITTVEIRRRQEEVAALEAPQRRTYQQILDEGKRLLEQLESACHPADFTTEALDAARLVWQARQHDDDEHRQFAHRWAAFVHQASAKLGERLESMCNVVGATSAALTHDAQLAQASDFDLLVFEGADRLTESEFLRVARRARRWVLIGEPAWEYAGQTMDGETTPLAPGSFLQKLWHRLHWDPRRLPFTWTREGSRLCCRFRSVAQQQRRWLEKEHVADCPQVELRILSLPRTPPTLAEVLFPADFSLAQAKEFIYRELQEVPIQARGTAAALEEQADRIVFRFDNHTVLPVTATTLAPGLRECLVFQQTDSQGNGARGSVAWTDRLEFDKEAGWTRDSVVDWLGRHLRFREMRRAIYLDTVHRMSSELAASIKRLLVDPARSTPPEPIASPATALQFFAVPASRDAESRRSQSKKTPIRAPSAAGAAASGLEQDLAAVRLGDRLPNDLRQHLPRRGIVNFLEAQALVRKLEDMVRQPTAFDGEPTGDRSAPKHRWAIIAFSAAQVELLRLLIRRSAVLASYHHEFEIGLPETFTGREFATVLLSLARSHGHRAVAYAECWHDWVIALTRARRQLIVLGDAATLFRRSQFSGRLEPLDDTTSAHEARLAAALLRHAH